MAEQRLSRKGIKQPDQFISFSVHIIDWVKKHTGLLLYSMLGVVVVTALVTGWWAWQKQHEQQAEIILYEATKLLYARPVNRSQAIERLQKLISSYGNTRAAALAYWHLGHLHFEGGGDYSAALTAYIQAQQYFRKTSQPLMLALVGLDIAYAQEASGSCNPDAVISFESVLQSPAHWLRGEAYLGIGRCHEHAGTLPKAMAVYERALSDGEVNQSTHQTISEHLAFLRLAAKEQGQEYTSPNRH